MTIKEKLYFKFRPKLEKNLYEIIKQGETSVSLDTVLYDFLREEDEGKLLKIAVDAYFYKLFFVFDALKTARAKNLERGLAKVYVERDITVADYIARLAKVIAEDGKHIPEVNEDIKMLWGEMQERAKLVLFYLQKKHRLCFYDLYAYGVPNYSREDLHLIHQEIKSLLVSDIDFSASVTNWATWIAALARN